jgi:hypothetical protein
MLILQYVYIEVRRKHDDINACTMIRSQQKSLQFLYLKFIGCYC